MGYGMLRTGAAPETSYRRAANRISAAVCLRESLGSGVGAALMQACITRRSVAVSNTLARCWEHNHRAQSFYGKWNFHEVERTYSN